jgi:small-conductance mechanosensitive channel
VGSKVLQARVSSSRNLTPSVQVLISQLGRFTLLFLAIMIALNVVGIDLTALAVFSGAVGVGIGFGLQKIVSNLISGIILLMDRSIKPGDVVELVGTYGWVSSLGARYTSVRTRDGTEHLIPNEEFIINRVVNWTHSDKTIRRKVLIGVHYKTDVPKAMELMLEATKGIKRIVADPKPTVLLQNFGDSSVDLETRFWIIDPANGVSNVASEYRLAVWRKFLEHGIEIPYPQRDLHIVTPPPGSFGQVEKPDVPAAKSRKKG